MLLRGHRGDLLARADGGEFKPGAQNLIGFRQDDIFATDEEYVSDRRLRDLGKRHVPGPRYRHIILAVRHLFERFELWPELPACCDLRRFRALEYCVRQRGVPWRSAYA